MNKATMKKDSQGTPRSSTNHFLSMSQLSSQARNNSNTNIGNEVVKVQQAWNNSAMNFPFQLVDTSLLGMARTASELTAKSRFMMQQPPQQQERPDTRAITSHVLTELSDDSLFNTTSPVSEDIFDLEPDPIAEHYLPEQQQQQQQHSSSALEKVTSNRLERLDNTLHPVLSNESLFFFDMGQSNASPTSSLAALSTPMINSNRNVFKRPNQEITSPLVSHQLLPKNKKQRTTPTNLLASPLAAMRKGEPLLLQDTAPAPPDTTEDVKGERFRDYQSKQWAEKFQQLMKFKKEHGHSCVPHTFTENPTLARWVKRQRYQYRLKNEQHKPSTMTNERILALERMGFVWDSHGAAWEERWNELKQFQCTERHCNVPSNYSPNPQLATWVKCQRRQYKLFWNNKPSNMTLERIAKLETLGFEWERRGTSKKGEGGINDVSQKSSSNHGGVAYKKI